MSSVTLAGVSKRFGSHTVLAPADLVIDDGEFVVIVGPSGCGKSTLLRLLAGLETPSTGTIRIGDRDVTALSPAERNIAMVFQSYALYPHLTVAENIAFPLKVARRPAAEIGAKVAAVAATLDLTDLLDRRPRALSGGQRQRVSIGRAIVRDPAVLLLDEPLSNLDAALRVRMRHEFARLHQALGATMVYVTHDQLEAMTLANRIVVMAAGRIEQVGAPMDLYRAPATIAVARAIGSPAMNLLPVTIATVDGAGATVALPDGRTTRAAVRVPAADVGAPATLGIRPEHLRLDDAGVFDGAVELFERLGPLSFAHVARGGADGSDSSRDVVVAQLPGDNHVTLGEVLRFAAPAADVHLFGADGAAYPLIPPPSMPVK